MSGAVTARVEPAPERPGLNIAIGEGVAPVVSPTWTIAGWRLSFVRLGPGQRFDLQADGVHYAKVITGLLAAPECGAYAEPKLVRDTRLSVNHLLAAGEGALLALFTRTAATPDYAKSMEELTWHGPLADQLGWRTFEAQYGAITSFFNGADAHLSPGFHLLDADGSEIAYVFVWTAGKGVDLSTHNHGHKPGPRNPAFAEVHWVLFNGTGAGGMYETAEPGAPDRVHFPMQRGQEHGPFFHFDPATGVPRLRDNGAVDYPWHGWQAGTDSAPGQAYDVVAAFEITVPYATVAP